jgi:hypothetical protein
MLLYRTIDLLACKRPRGSEGLAPGLSLPIILTLLSMIIDTEKAIKQIKNMVNYIGIFLTFPNTFDSDCLCI